MSAIEQYQKKVSKTAEFLRQQFSTRPDVGFLTGTGLGDCIQSIAVEEEIPYSDIPYFPISTVESHRGLLLFGSLKGRQILAMQGRFHLYEGYSPHEVTFPIRVMQALGIRTLILSNASGGLNPDFKEGDIMIIQDHINLTGENPLLGRNIEAWGPRFPDMSEVYDLRLADLARETAARAGVQVRQGVYAGLKGPSLETPAETRFLRRIGCDAVGFSTVLEAIAGVHAGMSVLGLATITNINNPDHPKKTDVNRIIRTAEKAAPAIDAIVAGTLKAR